MSHSIVELISLRAERGAFMETQSGLFSVRPVVFGAMKRAGTGRVAAILMHPTSNFHGHYLLGPLAERGISVLAMNSRYVNNDSTLIVGQVLEDLAAGVSYLRREGVEKVVLLGNSGGGALMATYQAEAEAGAFPSADGIGLLAAHPGRARFLTRCLDAAIDDERDPGSRDSEWDIFNAANGPPFSAEFLQGIESRQLDRNRRITQFARKKLEELAEAGRDASDEAFVVYCTAADPRFIDLTVDKNDRSIGTIWGEAKIVNSSANGTARFTTCRSFLSQWSLDATSADGPTNLERTSVPVLVLEYTADSAVFPSDTSVWCAACDGRSEYHAITKANHYLVGQPEKVEEVAELTANWIKSI